MNQNPIPQALDIEQAMIGRLMDASEKDPILDLKEDHFNLRTHKLIYRTINGMRERSLRVDALTVTTKLKDLGLLEEAGGAFYISSCVLPSINCMPEDCLAILEEKLRLRNLISISEKIQNQSFNNIESSKIIESLGNDLLNFQKDEKSGNMMPKISREVMDIIERKINGEVITGLKTGINLWDDMLGGLNPLFYVLAARGGRGKTAMLEQIVDALLLMEHPVLIFQNDMSLHLFILRLACRRAAIPFFKYDLNYCSKYELQEIKKHVEILNKSPIYLHSPANLTASKFCNIIKIEQRIHGIKAVFLDHVLKLDVGSDYRVGLTMASSKIRDSVEQTSIPHVILAQLNRGAHNEERPSPAHIKEFDALYADCDVMAMIWSNKDPKDVPPNEIFPMRFLVNKNRYGTEFEDEIGFDRAFMKFKPLKTI